MPGEQVDAIGTKTYTAVWEENIRITVMAERVVGAGWRFDASGIDPEDDGEYTTHPVCTQTFTTADEAIAAGIEQLRLFYEEGVGLSVQDAARERGPQT